MEYQVLYKNNVRNSIRAEDRQKMLKEIKEKVFLRFESPQQSFKSISGLNRVPVFDVKIEDSKFSLFFLENSGSGFKQN